MAKDCRDCSFYLSQEDSTVRFRSKNTGMEMCGKFGYPLNRKGFTEEQATALREATAKDCGHYKYVSPSDRREAKYRSHRELTPISIGVNPHAKAKEEKESVWACTGCKFYVKPEVVLSHLGWDAGACSARGLLMDELTAISSSLSDDCSFAVQETTDRAIQEMHLNDLILAPQYLLSASGAEKEARPSLPELPEGEELVRDPTDAEKAFGIEKLVKIRSPWEDGKYVAMPVFDPESFHPEDRETIPVAGGEGLPDLYMDGNKNTYSFLVEMLHHRGPLLIGPAGVGKTEICRHVAYRMNLPFYRIGYSEKMEREGLEGFMQFLHGETKFILGRFAERYSSAGITLNDEINRAEREVWDFLKPILDEGSTLNIEMAKMQIPRHPHRYLVFAVNPAWDSNYVGAQELDYADATRLHKILMTHPPAETEREILRTRCEREGYKIPQKTLDVLMKIAADLRTLCTNHEIPMSSWGVREQISVALGTRYYPIEMAYNVASLWLLDPAAADLIRDVIRSHLK